MTPITCETIKKTIETKISGAIDSFYEFTINNGILRIKPVWCNRQTEDTISASNMEIAIYDEAKGVFYAYPYHFIVHYGNLSITLASPEEVDIATLFHSHTLVNTIRNILSYYRMVEDAVKYNINCDARMRELITAVNIKRNTQRNAECAELRAENDKLREQIANLEKACNRK